jgi:hypothetical protein
MRNVSPNALNQPIDHHLSVTLVLNVFLLDNIDTCILFIDYCLFYCFGGNPISILYSII